MKKSLFIGLTMMLLSPIVQSAEVKRLFLTPEQRQMVEAERQTYLNRQNVKPLAIKSTAPKTNKSVKKQIKLPGSISVSSVIITPDGRKLVRINDHYGKLPIRTRVDKSQTSSSEIALKVNGKLVEVPLGETYLPRSGKTIKSYEYHRAAKRQPLKIKQEVKSRKETTNTLVKDIQKLQALTGGLTETSDK